MRLSIVLPGCNLLLGKLMQEVQEDWKFKSSLDNNAKVLSQKSTRYGWQDGSVGKVNLPLSLTI